MSRIGRMPIAIPAGVTVTIAENNKVTVYRQMKLVGGALRVINIPDRLYRLFQCRDLKVWGC